MQLKIWEFTKENAMEVCQWTYSGEYSIYDYPSWEEASKGRWGITIEEKRKNEFQSILNEKAGFRVVDKYKKKTPMGSGEFWRMEME